MIYVRKHPYSPGWYYASVFGWLPFLRFGAGGWIYMRVRWLWNAWGR